mgnify:CR=1 FL=1
MITKLFRRINPLITAIFLSFILHTTLIVFLVIKWDPESKPQKISAPKYIQAKLINQQDKRLKKLGTKTKPKPKRIVKAKPKSKDENKFQKKRKIVEQKKAKNSQAKKQLEQESHDKKMTSSYSAYITERIEANWNRPPSARRGMEAKLLIRLVPTGQVVSVALLKTSGNIAFDRSAEQAVYKVGNFDKLQKMDLRIFEKSFRQLELVFRPDDLRL